MKNIVAKFKDKKILVFGDVVLDLYIHGEVERISPEAPVPVILEKHRRFILGGAGNVAANAAALGGRVTLVGFIGRDPEGMVIEKLCRGAKIRGIFVKDASHPTTLKTRPVARRHQLLRIDRELTDAMPSRLETALTRIIRRLPHQDIVVVSDYAKGVLTRATMTALKRRFGVSHIIGGIKPRNASFYQNIELVTLNLREASELTRIMPDANGAAARAVRKLADYFRSSIVLTRGEHGMTIYERGTKKISHIPSRALQVFDVTGAGDTVLAVLGLAIGAGAKIAEAAEFANRAAGIVVGLEGTAVVSKNMLLSVLDPTRA